MITAEMRKQTSHHKDAVLTRLVENSLVEALKVDYFAAMEGEGTPLFNLVEAFIVDTVQQGMMHSLRIKNIEALTQSDSFMDALMR